MQKISILSSYLSGILASGTFFICKQISSLRSKCLAYFFTLDNDIFEHELWKKFGEVMKIAKGKLRTPWNVKRAMNIVSSQYVMHC